MSENTKLHWGFKLLWAGLVMGVLVALVLAVNYLGDAVRNQNKFIYGNEEGYRPLLADFDTNAPTLYDMAARGSTAHDYLNENGVIGRAKEIREFYNLWLLGVDQNVYEEYSNNGEPVPLCLSQEVAKNLGKLDFEINRQAFVLDFYGKRQLWWMHDTPTIQCFYQNADGFMQSIACDQVCDDRIFDTTPPVSKAEDVLQIQGAA